MAITPSSFSIAVGSSVELTSTINNAWWAIVSGSGALSAGSTSYKKIFTATGAGAVSIKAETDFWNALQSGYSLDANQNLVTDGGTHFAWTNARIKNIGDYFQITCNNFTAYIEQFFLQTSNSTVTSAYGLFYGDSSGLYYINGTSGTAGAWNDGDILRFEVASATSILLKRNSTIIGTITHTETGGFLCGYYSANHPAGTIPKPVFYGIIGITTETVSGTAAAGLMIDTASPLAGGTVGVSYSQTITASGGSGSVSYSVTGGALPPGLNLSSAGLLSGTPTTAGTYSFIVSATDGTSTPTRTFSLTIAAGVTIPVSRWSQMNIVPRSGLLAWHALDNATSSANVDDFSGNNRPLAGTSGLPALQTNVLNGLPALYFDGTSNPIKWSGAISPKHIFIVAAFFDAAFTNFQGLLTGIANAGGDVLISNPSGDTFFNIAYSAFGAYIYKKSDVGYAENSQKAPMAGNFAVLEVVFANGVTLDGLQIGQQKDFTARKFKGWFVEDLIYGSVLSDCDRLDVYRYLSMKFHLWRETATGLKIFPFANDKKITSTPSKVILESQSISGAYKARAKSGLIRSFEAGYSLRRQEEFDAAEDFANQNYPGKTVAFEDNSMYPARIYPVRINSMPVRDSENYFHDYKVGLTSV